LVSIPPADGGEHEGERQVSHINAQWSIKNLDAKGSAATSMLGHADGGAKLFSRTENLICCCCHQSDDALRGMGEAYTSYAAQKPLEIGSKYALGRPLVKKKQCHPFLVITPCYRHRLKNCNIST